MGLPSTRLAMSASSQLTANPCGGQATYCGSEERGEQSIPFKYIETVFRRADLLAVDVQRAPDVQRVPGC